MASVGARKYTQIAVQIPDGSAEPTVRAGFMLIPESGDSTLMKVATRKPATHGVNRVNLPELETFKTIEIRRNEIVNSAPNATHGPEGVPRSDLAEAEEIQCQRGIHVRAGALPPR